MALTADELFPGRPDLAEAAKANIAEAERRLDEAVLNYRFVWQMLGEGHELPTREAMVMIVADAYIRAMREWDGIDPVMPLTFAALTVREVTRNDT